jgi:hypothetical protein
MAHVAGDGEQCGAELGIDQVIVGIVALRLSGDPQRSYSLSAPIAALFTLGKILIEF